MEWGGKKYENKFHFITHFLEMFFTTECSMSFGRVVSREYRLNLSRSKIWEKTQVMILISKDTKRSEKIYITEKR